MATNLPVINYQSQHFDHFRKTCRFLKEALYSQLIGHSNLLRVCRRGIKHEWDTFFPQERIRDNFISHFNAVHARHIDVAENNKRLLNRGSKEFQEIGCSVK